jgi:hypothetical protein
VTPHAVEWSVRIPVAPQPEQSLAVRGDFAAIAPAVLFDVLKITSTSVAREGWVVSAPIVAQIALLAATIGAFAFMLWSLWATLKLTFVGVPEGAPEVNEATEF